MKINIFGFEQKEAQKAELRGKLNLPATVKLDLAFDAVHGLNDLCRSLADLHPHKRSIAILGPQPTPLKELISGFKGQGFVVQELPVSILEFDEEKLRTAWDALKKDTLFVLTSALEPFTGAVYPFEWIRREGPKKNIFTLIYMSPDALKRGVIVPSTPFEGIVVDPLWNTEHSVVAVLKGERCQGDSLFWGDAHFSDAGLRQFAENILALRSEISPVPGVSNSRVGNPHESEEDIKKFEAEISKRCGVALLGLKSRRYYDRAVLFVPGANGEAVSHGLKKEGFETFTAAACAWNNPHLNSWLPKLGLTPELVESSLIIPLAVIQNPKFEEALVAQIKELQQISKL